MNQKGFALALILFILAIFFISLGIVIGSLYIKNNPPEWLNNLKANTTSSVATKQPDLSSSDSNILTEATPCVKFNYPSDFKLIPKSVIKTTNEIKEGASEYGSAVLVLEKATSVGESYAIIVSCLPSQWSNAQKSLSKSNLETLKATLNSDINSGKDPSDQEPVRYDLAQSQVGNIQNAGNLTATKIVEVFSAEKDSLWTVKENIYALNNNYFYQFINTGFSYNKNSIIAEIKQFESLFQNAVLTNPIISTSKSTQ